MNIITKTLLVTFSLITLSACSSTIENKESFQKGLYKTITREAVDKGFSIYEKGNSESERLVIIDYTKPSEVKRFYVINMKHREIENQTYVSHAINSGYRKPYLFSNRINSNMTSIGAYTTGEMYNGKNGLSLRVDGHNKETNSNARKRYIVIHGATYAESSFIQKNGMLGRSEGCFAIPMSEHKNIIPKISNNTPMYVHY